MNQEPLITKWPLERWMPIPGWIGTYEVSDLGRVRRLAGLGADGRRLQARLLAIANAPNQQNYRALRVNLGTAADHQSYLVSRLVLLAFVGPPRAGEECRHLDDNPEDCRLVNLAWGTRQQNREDAMRNGKMAKGSRNGSAKVTESDVVAIRRQFVKHSHSLGMAALARRYGIGSAAIYDILRNRTWRHV